MAMHSAVLLAAQNERLLAENERQKRKKAKKRSYIAKGGALTGAEALSLIENSDGSQNNGTAEVLAEVRPRASCKCSLCSSLEHTACTCPERQSIV
jgi:hypothetical protein